MGEDVEFGAPWGGPADGAAPSAPKSKPFTPCFSLRSSFSPSRGEAHSPISEPPPAAKMHNWEEAGWGGWGAWTGWGSLWKGPDGALGAPLVSASSVHGPGARTTVPGTEVPRGGLSWGWGGGGRGPGEEGGREKRGGERKSRGGGGGGERATRQSCECACADLARCPGEGESEERQDLELWRAVRERGFLGTRRLVLGLECPFP